jgi:Protein kinase domain
MTNANQTASLSPSVTMSSSVVHDKQPVTNSVSSKLVTPESEGSTSVSSQEDSSSAEFLSPIHSMKNLSVYWTNSSVTPATVQTHVEVEDTTTNNTNLKTVLDEPCTREPSPQHERRTLFHDYSRDDYPTMEIHNKSIFNQLSASVLNVRSQEYVTSTPMSGAPALPAGKKDFERFHSSGSEMRSNGSHRLRSRRYQQNQLADSGSIPGTQSITSSDHRRKQSRRRMSNTSRSTYTDVNGNSHLNLSFSLPVVHINDEISISSDADSEGLCGDTPRKMDRKYRSRPRRKQISSSISSDLSNCGNNNSNNVGDNTTWATSLFGKFLILQRNVTTNVLVWSLCFVGLISTAMVVTTSHKISHSFDENPHERVTILFQTPKRQSKSNFRVRMLPTLDRPLAGVDRIGNQQRQGGSVNLHSLSRFQDDRSIVSSTSNDTPDSHTKHTKSKTATKHKHSNQRKHLSHSNDEDNEKAVPLGSSFEPSELVLVHPNTIILESNTLSISMNEVVDSRYSSENKRITMIGGDVDLSVPRHRDMELYPTPFTDNTQLYPILDSSDEEEERIRTMERRPPYENEECVPMADWQTTYYPSCNGMHELNLADYDDSNEKLTLFGKNGFWRNAWRFDSSVSGPSLETVILKTLRINHRFEDKYFEHNRIDAVVLERLTGSRHVIDIFGFCGHSVLTEFADGKRLGDLADKNKKNPLARLRIAIDIASGLADVHSIDGEDNASFVHLDINPANVVSVNGTLKLNDFNIGVPRKWNKTSNEACGIPSQYPNPQWRSPEEARGENTLTEKVDVFSLGHIFFRLICGHEPWHKLEPNGMPSKHELNEKVKNGILPTIPNTVLKSKDPEVIAIRDAMLECYQYNPADRPSARSIVQALQSTLTRLEKKKHGKNVIS